MFFLQSPRVVISEVMSSIWKMEGKVEDALFVARNLVTEAVPGNMLRTFIFLDLLFTLASIVGRHSPRRT